MKKFFKIPAFLLVIMLVLSCFAGCHEKGEIAYTIGEHKYTSGMYSCVLYIAASDARNDINEFVSQNSGDTKNIKYDNYKFDENGKVSATGTISYRDFVKQQAVYTLKRFALVDDKIKAANISITEEDINTAKVQASYYWYAGCDYSTYAYYGSSVSQYFTPYSVFFEANGVSYNTYEQYMINELKYSRYFETLYGEGGEKAVSEDTLKDNLKTHYAIADTIIFSTLGDDGKVLTGDSLKAVETKANDYAKRFNDGEAFDVLYKEVQESLQTDSSTSSTSSDTSSDVTSSTSSDNTSSDSSSSDEKEYTPEVYKMIYGDDTTEYDTDFFEVLKNCTVGKAEVINDANNSCYRLVVKRDILEQDYWLENLRTPIIYSLKQDEFDKSLQDEAAKLTATEDKHATKPFKVKNIKF